LKAFLFTYKAAAIATHIRNS